MPKPPEEMGTPSSLRMLPTAAEVLEPTAVFWGKELRMGPGRVTTTCREDAAAAADQSRFMPLPY